MAVPAAAPSGPGPQTLPRPSLRSLARNPAGRQAPQALAGGPRGPGCVGAGGYCHQVAEAGREERVTGASRPGPRLAVLGLVAQSCPTLCDRLGCSPPGSCVRGDSPGRNTGCQALLQGIFLTQGSNPGLLHCRRILDCQSHQRSPRIRKRVPVPSPGGLPHPGTEPGSPALQAGSLPAELPRKPWPRLAVTLGRALEPGRTRPCRVPCDPQLIHVPKAREQAGGVGGGQDPPLASLSTW